MTEEEWCHFFASGSPTSISVTRIHPDICRAIGASTNLVRLRHNYLSKMVFKHGLEPYQLPMLENTIAYGCAIMDRAGHATFFYYDEVVFGSWFQATIKSAEAGSEVWVATFHPQRDSEVRRRRRKHPLIRPEKW